MSVDFWTFSGWLFGLISLIFGVIQFFQKTKYKKELNKKEEGGCHSKKNDRLKIRCQYTDNNGVTHNFDSDFSEAYENDTQIKVTFEDGSHHSVELSKIVMISFIG